MGRLTTHILDTSQGRPASGVTVRLFWLGKERRHLVTAVTNSDGRTEAPLVQDDLMPSGEYELEFDIGDYFASIGASTSEPAFLSTVVIRFAVRSDENYHVPLVATPWSYSTYRGS